MTGSSCRRSQMYPDPHCETAEDSRTNTRTHALLQHLERAACIDRTAKAQMALDRPLTSNSTTCLFRHCFLHVPPTLHLQNTWVFSGPHTIMHSTRPLRTIQVSEKALATHTYAHHLESHGPLDKGVVASSSALSRCNLQTPAAEAAK